MGVVSHNKGGVDAGRGTHPDATPPDNAPDLAVEMWATRPEYVEAVVFTGTDLDGIATWAGCPLPMLKPGDAVVRWVTGTVEVVRAEAIAARFDRDGEADPIPMSDTEALAFGAVFAGTDDEGRVLEVEAASIMDMGRWGGVAVFTTDDGTARGYFPLNDHEQAELREAVLTVYGEDHDDDDVLAMSIVIGNGFIGGHKVFT